MTGRKTAVVTGASSGIGYETAALLRDRGYTVYGISRRGSAPDGCTALPADIGNCESVNAAIKTIAEKEGGIDLLVNNAGMGISGPVEFADNTDIDSIVRVNFLGQIYCSKAVLPYMREKKNGTIIFVSSVAGSIAIPYQAFYSATKSALLSLTLALKNEVREFGIKVCAVLPGDVSTGFTDARRKNEEQSDIYPGNISATAAMEIDERNGMKPTAVAKAIVKAAEERNPRPVRVVGGKYRVFASLFKFLPSRLSYFIVGKMYK